MRFAQVKGQCRVAIVSGDHAPLTSMYCSEVSSPMASGKNPSLWSGISRRIRFGRRLTHRASLQTQGSPTFSHIMFTQLRSVGSDPRSTSASTFGPRRTASLSRVAVTAEAESQPLRPVAHALLRYSPRLAITDSPSSSSPREDAAGGSQLEPVDRGSFDRQQGVRLNSWRVALHGGLRGRRGKEGGISVGRVHLDLTVA